MLRQQRQDVKRNDVLADCPLVCQNQDDPGNRTTGRIKIGHGRTGADAKRARLSIVADRSKRPLRVEPCRSISVPRPAGIGASRPLPRAQAMVSFPIT
jgi:hypothetical protein